jgi:orotidine-5'-phosphate decarboxylase
MNSKKLIVALDVDTASAARELVARLRHIVGMFKIGMQLFTAAGPAIVREIISDGNDIFLDLKYHDIPNTVAAAGVEAARLGVSIFNVHASGGREMMSRTANAVAEVAEKENLKHPRVIAVTVLTSADAAVLSEINVAATPADQVLRMAELAAESGLDGVVASPLEAHQIRNRVSSGSFLIVTPGVRPAGAAAGDQRRVTTPAAAIRAGADYLVVGRPIIAASDPVAAATQIAREIDDAIGDLSRETGT